MKEAQSSWPAAQSGWARKTRPSGAGWGELRPPWRGVGFWGAEARPPAALPWGARRSSRERHALSCLRGSGANSRLAVVAAKSSRRLTGRAPGTGGGAASVSMMKFKPNQTRTYDREGFKKRAACLCFRSEREDEVRQTSSGLWGARCLRVRPGPSLSSCCPHPTPRRRGLGYHTRPVSAAFVLEEVPCAEPVAACRPLASLDGACSVPTSTVSLAWPPTGELCGGRRCWKAMMTERPGRFSFLRGGPLGGRRLGWAASHMAYNLWSSSCAMC